MRAVVSRVTHARVTVDGATVGALDAPGLLVLLGVHREDTEAAVEPMARKLHELRLLRDEESAATPDGRAPLRSVSAPDGRAPLRSVSAPDGRAPLRSVSETGAGLLVVSQFTLHGDTRKGRRPAWSAAAPGEAARVLVDAVVAALRARGATVAEGVFGADMVVESANDGPFTVLVEV